MLVGWGCPRWRGRVAPATLPHQPAHESLLVAAHPLWMASSIESLPRLTYRTRRRPTSEIQMLPLAEPCPSVVASGSVAVRFGQAGLAHRSCRLFTSPMTRASARAMTRAHFHHPFLFSCISLLAHPWNPSDSHRTFRSVSRLPRPLHIARSHIRCIVYHIE